jgi:hypothetical protein
VTEVEFDDLLRAMIVIYGLMAISLNARNLWLIRRYAGEFYFRVTARSSAVMVGFAVVALADQLTRLQQTLSWRLPVLVLCFSGYLWVQLVVTTQIEVRRADADRGER